MCFAPRVKHVFDSHYVEIYEVGVEASGRWSVVGGWWLVVRGSWSVGEVWAARYGQRGMGSEAWAVRCRYSTFVPPHRNV
jgi:hypothetical protein